MKLIIRVTKGRSNFLAPEYDTEMFLHIPDVDIESSIALQRINKTWLKKELWWKL